MYQVSCHFNIQLRHLFSTVCAFMFGLRKFQDIVIMSPWRGHEMNVISKIYWNSVEFSRKEMGKLCDQAYTKRLGITSRLFWQANKSPMWLVNMVILMFFSLCGWFKLLTDDDEWPRVKSCTEEYFPCTMTVFYDPESIFNIIPHRPDWIACLVSNLCKFEDRSKLKETSLGFLI